VERIGQRKLKLKPKRKIFGNTSGRDLGWEREF
jgi:hypothetical protein